MKVEYGVYEVIGTRRYRDHAPGTRFEARLDRDAERRAIARGNIRLIERVQIRVPDAHTFPEGWLPMLEPVSSHQEAHGAPAKEESR